MPELPEVEVTRRSFAQHIAGARICQVVLGKPLRWPLGVAHEALLGLTVEAVNRRGKYLLLMLSANGSNAPQAAGLLLLHLGMSGSLRFDQAPLLQGPHDHFMLETSRGTLRLRDPRRFGAVVFAPDLIHPVATKLLGHLGMEPLSGDFNAGRFAASVSQSRAPIKQILLSGRVVVGVGNIYACEVLFWAGIDPFRRGDHLGPDQLNRLHQSIQRVLAHAVERGGTTLRDFSNADGHAGYFQADAQVYGREGLNCLVCGGIVVRATQSQRSTYFCPHCQSG